MIVYVACRNIDVVDRAVASRPSLGAGGGGGRAPAAGLPGLTALGRVVGRPRSPDIWKSIFWLQQRPGDPSADIAYTRGRQGYLAEIMGTHPQAIQLYPAITTA